MLLLVVTVFMGCFVELFTWIWLLWLPGRIGTAVLAHIKVLLLVDLLVWEEIADCMMLISMRILIDHYLILVLAIVGGRFDDGVVVGYFCAAVSSSHGRNWYDTGACS